MKPVRVFQIVMLGMLACLQFCERSLAAQPQPSPMVLDVTTQDKCLQVLRDALRSDEFWPSMHAAEGLTLAGHGAEVLRRLTPRVEVEEDDQRRCGLARELVRAGDRARASIMLDILASDDPYGHVHACESLYKVNEIGDGRLLREALSQNDNARQKLMAAAALGRWGNPSAMAFVRGCLLDTDAEVARIAAWILARVGDQRDISSLRAGVRKFEDPLTRAYFQHALASLGDADGLASLVRNLNSDDAAIRTYAATFTGEARVTSGMNRLRELVDDDEIDVRVRAAQSLLVMSLPAPPDPRDEVTRDVYSATQANPRYSEGSILALRRTTGLRNESDTPEGTVSDEGTLLFAVTEFIGSGSDFAKARVIARESRDGGRTWGPSRVLQKNIGKQNVMSVTLRRLAEPPSEDAPIGMFYMVKNGYDDLDAFLRISHDEARTFGEPILITDRPGYHVLNNDRVTMLSTGRLLVPVASTSDVKRVNHFVSSCFLSDDGGTTWRRGRSTVDFAKRGAMEPDVFERVDGTLGMILRTQLGYIAISNSNDGGDTWSEARSWNVRAPEAPATLRRIPSTGDLLLIWNDRYDPGAGHSGRRTPLTASISSDEGETWRHKRNLETSEDHTYAYTSLGFEQGRAVMSYYVRDEQSGYVSCRFRSMPIAWFYDQELEYLSDVKRPLETKCFSCHGVLKQEGGLRLDTGDLIRMGGDSGSAVDLDDPDASLLIERLSAIDADERMPPDDNTPLTPDQIDAIRKWIADGALSPEGEMPQPDPSDHWSLQPLAKAERHASVDRFVQRRLSEAGLTLNPPAHRATLIRRLYLDMHGLPPAPKQTAAFVADNQPAAYVRLVERVLASPRYGERWAQHWLDVVRYADTDGFEVNTPRENAWPYRDFVISAFNEDKPYDQFVRQQLAGDTCGYEAATGFLVAAPALLPGQIGKDAVSMRLARQDALDEIIVGTSATFLGLTVGCARCHDHKFDPITQRDYYAMQALFAGVEYGEREVVHRSSSHPLQGKIDPETSRPLFAGVFREPDVTHVLRRGDPEQPEEQIDPRMIAIFGEHSLSESTSDQDRRVALADWVTGAALPITARVMANRVWQGHFGTGIVETPSDFGMNGAKPSHPDLLDWLAREFVDSGWSVKHVHRLILLSRTYRQSSRIRPTAKRRDVDCRLLWRYPSRRLEAEAIRDSILLVCDQLNLTAGGPGFNFFKTRGGLSGFPPLEEFGANEKRRMIYSHKIRMERAPVFGVFDCPDAGLPTPKRTQSTTAIQALNLLNSSFVVDQAIAFSRRLRSLAGESVDQQVRLAFELACGRCPSDVEHRVCVAAARHDGMETVCRAILNSNEFLFIP